MAITRRSSMKRGAEHPSPRAARPHHHHQGPSTAGPSTGAYDGRPGPAKRMKLADEGTIAGRGVRTSRRHRESSVEVSTDPSVGPALSPIVTRRGRHATMLTRSRRDEHQKPLKPTVSTTATNAATTTDTTSHSTDSGSASPWDAPEPAVAPADEMEALLDERQLPMDLPVVVDVQGEAHVAFKSLDDADVASARQMAQGRWPLAPEADESSTFALLVGNKRSASSNTDATVSATVSDEAASAPAASNSTSEPGLEDFLDCESLTEDDDSDSASPSSPEASPSPTTPSVSTFSSSTDKAAAAAATTTFWSEKNIPICGYRCRNDSNSMVSFPPPNRARLMAALSSIEGADYQQAVIVATGMNRRSLLSGRARQMFA